MVTDKKGYPLQRGQWVRVERGDLEHEWCRVENVMGDTVECRSPDLHARWFRAEELVVIPPPPSYVQRYRDNCTVAAGVRRGPKQRRSK